MREEFEPHYDPRISMVVFVQEDHQLSIELVAHNKEKAIELEGDILSARRIYDMDPPRDLSLTAKQNFEVECDETRATLAISGNLFNAFNLLRNRKLINGDLAESILKNSKVETFLESTKSFVIEVGSSNSMGSNLAKFRLNEATVSKTVFSSLDEAARFLSELPDSEYNEVLRKVQELRAQKASRQTLISSK